MKVELVRVGNSRAIRIPKAIIEQCGFGDRVDLRVVRNTIVIAADRQPRDGWDQAFRNPGSSARDELLLEGLPPNRFDSEEWEW
jgi:antitoxin MazE